MENLHNWWIYEANATDKTNVVCFIIVMIISVICIIIAKK